MSSDTGLTPEWVAAAGDRVAHHFERELEALVAVSSPSGDAAAAEELCALVAALLPDDAEIERPSCSTAGYAPDLLATLGGSGSGRVLLLGHLDTVIAHADHRPLERRDGRLVGSGSVDMKGGVAIALGVLRALAAVPESFAELTLLTVVDEEWRTGGFDHGPRFAGYDACLCFEAGQLAPGGEEAVVAKRKAAATMRVTATGVAAHSGSSPEKGRNALLALGEAARRVAALGDPAGPERLTATPTVLRSGESFNVVPANGELICDLRAERLEAFDPLLEALPAEIDGVGIEAELVRRWPGMDSRELVAERLAEPATALLGSPLLVGARGGASDASHMAEHVALTVDGLGPRGGHAHHPDEYVSVASVRPRAEIALALAAAALAEPA
ncbi:MAG: glutamate carboxypeptidase [Solirubrobacterales bacterium]|jgi:glutamate carboxypeptidase|nr:glutamate carboxypeptidase [Solirubrobacterales bacterium]